MSVPTYIVPACGLALIMAGCAATPRPAATPAAAPAVAAPAVTSHVVTVDKLTADQIVQLQRQGYKLVTTNGERLFCSSEPKTGSRVQRDDVCKTEREMVMLRERTRSGLQNIEMQQPPKQGT
jgi:hypothetical protein